MRTKRSPNILSQKQQVDLSLAGKGECNVCPLPSTTHAMQSIRSLEEVSDIAEISPPPTKISHVDDISRSPTPQSAKVTLLTPSPEQKARMEDNKLEAESKIVAKKFGADKIGHTWMVALQAEFKKQYINKVNYAVQWHMHKINWLFYHYGLHGLYLYTTIISLIY